MLNYILQLFGRITLRERQEMELHEALCEFEELDSYRNMLTARIHRLRLALAKPNQDPVHSIINKETSQ